jgi:hypothetical protein
MSKTIAAALCCGVLLAVAAPLPAKAQPQACAPRAMLVERLTVEFGESQQFIGLTADGMAMEVFVGPAGAWTLLATYPDGTSCLVVSGTDFQLVPPPASPANPA